MADITITVTISEVYKQVARRTSVATEADPQYAQSSTEKKQYSQLHGEGDRITLDFVTEAAKEVLKAYLSRQGDVIGVPFEQTAADIIYRFAEGTPALGQKDAIESRLQDNTRDAVIYYVLVSLYRTDGNQNKYAEMLAKAKVLIDELSGDLYRLHD